VSTTDLPTTPTTSPTDQPPDFASDLDVAVTQARAAHDALLTQVDQITTDTDRADYWTRMATAETQYAEAREARGDIGDWLSAEKLRDLATRSLFLAEWFATAVTA
jgi:hypothetical protein